MKTKLVTLLFFAINITQAQSNFYEAIEANGAAAVYQGFKSVKVNGDGTFNFVKGNPAVTLSITKLPTGQPVGFVATPVSADYGGFSQTELSDYGRVDHYPHVMTIRHERTGDGYMMINDLIFELQDIPNDGALTLNNVKSIYAKVKDAVSDKSENNKKKKKKGGFLGRMKGKLSTGKTPTNKYVNSLNIVKIFNDYVAAMKAKQATPLTAKDNVDIAKIKRARKAGDEEIKRYNDSIKATPEYQDLQRRIKQNEANYQAAKSQNTVTLRNTTGRTIYIGKSGSRNPGTKISSGGTASWSCDTDAYLQVINKSGGSNAYSSTTTKVYSANSGCGSTVDIN